jgi:hypothetical protein
VVVAKLERWFSCDVQYGALVRVADTVAGGVDVVNGAVTGLNNLYVFLVL